MKLELRNILINDIQFGKTTEIKNNTLYINKQELLEVIKDDRLINMDIEIVKPGESVRLCPVKDVIEPRVKIDSNTKVFPGLGNNPATVGEGNTNVLKGMAVITVGQIVGFQEGIIDMSGPGAEYSPFSKTINLVILSDKANGLKQHQHEDAIRQAGLRTSEYLAEVSKNIEPDEVLTFETKPVIEQINQYPELPKVAYVYMLQSQGLLHDTYLYGIDVKKILPTFVYPTEIMDGAIISGNCVSACDKNTTFHHQNNPVIHDLYKRHGQDINFLGVIVTNENVTLLDKERSSDYCTKLVKHLGVNGVVISKEGFGNPDTDLIMNCKKMESAGIKTVLITDEFAGTDGASQSLADGDKAANAVISCGNANELIELPPMEKYLGYADVANVIAGGSAKSLKENGTIIVELQAIIGATNELGFNELGAIGA
ncbi:Glycine reductase component B beta subunit [Candidatus Syntrophocurvum alkaliphilum]|uniref:Glycine reductase component B beta subunit n=1 Tax=Candidatus Syntrophocurvum alkaliphilum TaxID=2293317 RepID=A0A6I6DCB1_9FIRM|nr:glycine/sarcosine/betaine reductase component B subunit [Candidatus Syntrophocurvum alkaliphilum]QGT99889.1 Glycine reductase component B beta subunit [Candidatus Syntrophocurvum alkaliphilum]